MSPGSSPLPPPPPQPYYPPPYPPPPPPAPQYPQQPYYGQQYAQPQYPAQYGYPQAPQPPAVPAGPGDNWTSRGLGLTGGLIALVGFALPWLVFRVCSGGGGFNFCLTVPAPPGFSLGTFDPILGFGAGLAALLALVGLALIFLDKPVLGLLSGLMGLGAALLAIMWLASATANLDAISMSAGGGGASASFDVDIGFGVYVTIVGGFLLTMAGIMRWKQLQDVAAQAASATTAAAPAATTPAAPAPVAPASVTAPPQPPPQ